MRKNMNRKKVMRTLAKDLDCYVRARADVEGVSYELSPAFFTAAIKMGVVSYFGVDVDLAKGVLLRDRQEPWPGFLEAWLSRRNQPTAAPELRAHGKPADVSNSAVCEEMIHV